MLLQQTPVDAPEQWEERARFTGKFQQITSPVAAKGIEDTALYVYNRLLSVNEVGSDPTQLGLQPTKVHDWLAERRRRWPLALSATATHDSKRGEDVRARLNVLSEIPGAWKAAVTKWRAQNRRLKTEVKGAQAPGGNEEYFLYQTLVGAWPFDADRDGAPTIFRERLTAYMMKALREAKVHTSWLSPDVTYEKAVERFVEAILDRRRSSQFLQSFLAFQARVAELGMYNGLAQLLIKITAPGVPDFYQGTELWDLNLVDPDNRRPVDYGKRREVLAAVTRDGLKTVPYRMTGANRTVVGDSLQTVPSIADELFEHRADGRVKLFVTTRSLEARAQWRHVYEQGDYVPLPASGARCDHVFAFARRHGGDVAITCVPRLVASVIPDGAPPIGSVWGDTRIDVAPALAALKGPPGVRLRDVFTSAILEPDEARTIPVSKLFERFPVALLVLVPSNPSSPSGPSRPSRPSRP
jgi:(1->4)-alpha-D-glucan 1-alpha-D-glucosylmutase